MFNFFKKDAKCPCKSNYKRTKVSPIVQHVVKVFHILTKSESKYVPNAVKYFGIFITSKSNKTSIKNIHPNLANITNYPSGEKYGPKMLLSWYITKKEPFFLSKICPISSS